MSIQPIARLTPSSLSVALQAVANASSDEACAAALCASAALLQNAIITGLSGAEFHEALNAVPVDLLQELQATLDRTANFHQLDEGNGDLGLWLLPVGIHAESELPPVISLEPRTTPFVMASLQAQLGLNSDALGHGNTLGWTYAVPKLYSESTIRNATIDALVKFPLQAHNAIRNPHKVADIDLDIEATGPVTGVHVYYMPFVAFHPVPPQESLKSERTMHLMTKWVTESIKAQLPNAKFDVFVAPRPDPFSFALDEGLRVKLEVAMRVSMANIINKYDIAANGLAALVAPYHVKQTQTLMLGVSFVSRLTKNKLVGVTLPVHTEDAQAEIKLVKRVLYELGMDQIQVHGSDPIGTIACQHCGRIQLAMPTDEFAQYGIAPEIETVQ